MAFYRFCFPVNLVVLQFKVTYCGGAPKRLLDSVNFWRFSAGVSRDCRGGIIARFCTLVWHHPPSWHQLYTFVAHPYNSTFTLWLPIRNSVPACFSCFLCYCFTYAHVFLPVVLFVGFLDGVLLESFLLAEILPPTAFFLLEAVYISIQSLSRSQVVVIPSAVLTKLFLQTYI